MHKLGKKHHLTMILSLSLKNEAQLEAALFHLVRSSSKKNLAGIANRGPFFLHTLCISRLMI